MVINQTSPRKILDSFCKQTLMSCEGIPHWITPIRTWRYERKVLNLTQIIPISHIQVLFSQTTKKWHQSFIISYRAMIMCILVSLCRHHCPGFSHYSEGGNAWKSYRLAQGTKGNHRGSIGYCPHLWKSPLQPFQHAQQSHWLLFSEGVPKNSCHGCNGNLQI